MLIDASIHHAVEELMVRAADTAIMPRLGTLLASEMHHKTVDELVTIADRESEAILADGLHKLIPEARIVGEEAADAEPSVLAELGNKLCWIIDPLDGTANFAAGNGPFGLLVALASEGIPIGGWIFDPQSRRFCAAAAGSGASINGEPVKTRPSSKSRPLAAVSTLLASIPESLALADRIGADFDTISIPRCAAEQYPRMVLGGSDVTLFGRTLPWDHAAGILFLIEAGGVATRFDGAAYQVTDDRFGLIAAVNEELWQRAMEAAH